MRRTSHQHGSLKLADRRKGKVWEFRWREVQIDGSVCRKNVVVGTLEEFSTESAAQSAVDAIRLTINRQTPQQLLKNVSVETLVKHYQEHELPDIFSKQKPATGSSDEHHKSYSTQYAYDIYLKNHGLGRRRGLGGRIHSLRQGRLLSAFRQPELIRSADDHLRCPPHPFRAARDASRLHFSPAAMGLRQPALVAIPRAWWPRRESPSRSRTPSWSSRSRPTHRSIRRNPVK